MQVPARLNEMTKRGQVFKPDPNKPEFKLTIQGEKWVEDFIDKWYNPDTIKKFVFFLKSPKKKFSSGNALIYRNAIHEIPGLHRKILFVLGDLFPTLTFMKRRYKCNSKLKALIYYPHRLGKILWLIRK